MTSSEETRRYVLDAIGSLSDERPKPLLRTVVRELQDDGLPEIDEEELLGIIIRGDANDDAQRAFHIKLAGWDGAERLDDRITAANTVAGTTARRDAVLSELGMSASAQQRINEQFALT